MEAKLPSTEKLAGIADITLSGKIARDYQHTVIKVKEQKITIFLFTSKQLDILRVSSDSMI